MKESEIELAEFDFLLSYNPGKNNMVADALGSLSCHWDPANNCTPIRERVRQGLSKDPFAVTLMQHIREGKPRRFWMETP